MRDLESKKRAFRARPALAGADRDTSSPVFADDEGTLDLCLVFLHLQLLFQLGDGLNRDLPQPDVLVLFFCHHAAQLTILRQPK